MDRLRYPRRADDRIFAEIAGCFSASGARCSGATPAQVEAAARFGFQAGTAIQLSDDLGDVWNDKERHSDGLSDIRERRVTAAVAYALQHEGAAQEQLRAYYQATRHETETFVRDACADFQHQ
ncbi:hypothetical protein GCM10010302_06150 [Streptomyces polychromogenes]|uniref:Uncharacterized protein n=1 Tax=Streptomyces polychromogenes TaxID=67342 RepID=A0ABP3EP12_9ACTN